MNDYVYVYIQLYSPNILHNNSTQNYVTKEQTKNTCT